MIHVILEAVVDEVTAQPAFRCELVEINFGSVAAWPWAVHEVNDLTQSATKERL